MKDNKNKTQKRRIVDMTIKLGKGQSAFTNAYVEASKTGKYPFANDVMTCLPYACLHVLSAWDELYDTTINASSLPSGTYNGIEYTISDTTLSAKDPRNANKIAKIAEHVMKSYFTAVNPTDVTLVVDAIGCIISNSAAGYANAQALLRIVNSHKFTDEDKMPVAAMLQYPGRNSLDTTAPEEIISSVNWNADLKSQFEDTIPTLTKLRNGTLAFYPYFYLSPEMRASIKLLNNRYIKLRSVDADTERYMAFWPSIPGDADCNTILNNIKTYARRCQELCNRWTFIGEILEAMGLTHPDDKFEVDTDGKTFEYILDDNDDIKNLVDHVAYPYQAGAPLVPDAAYKDYLAVEDLTYLNGTGFDYTEQIIVKSGILSALLYSHLYTLNVSIAQVEKKSDGSVNKYMNRMAAQKAYVSSASGTPAPAFMYRLCLQQYYFDTVNILDSDYVFALEWAPETHSWDLHDRVLYNGMNTYVAHSTDMGIIASNNAKIMVLGNDQYENLYNKVSQIKNQTSTEA